jgi:CPA2 family monovalent cation:H+ antiporter-2
MIVVGLGLAFVFGALAHRLRLPPLAGYLVAGVVVGPHTPGFVADQTLGAQLAEIGVVLLMFGVGLQFSPKDLTGVRALAVPGAIGQIALAAPLGAGLGLAMGWSLGASIIFGFSLSIASTVVVLKALQDRRLIETERGKLAVGWVIVEDILTVLALVLIPAIASLYVTRTGASFDPLAIRLFGPDVGVWGVVVLTVLKLAGFAGLMLIAGKRMIPWVLHEVAHTGSRELFRLAVLVLALGAALGSAMLFGVSLALGAFFAGMILSESELSQRAAQETLPLRDAFAVLFFVSVGMLFDPAIVIHEPLPLLGVIFIILFARSAIVFAIAAAFGQSASVGLTIAASRAQIGEFSFILASIGVSLAILPPRAQDLIVAGALITIVLNAPVFWAFGRLEPALASLLERLRKPIEPAPTEGAPGGAEKPALPPEAESAAAIKPDAAEDAVLPTSLSGHVIVVGYGRVGKAIAEGLHASGAPFLIVEDAAPRVAEARAAGFEVVIGNGATAEALTLANAAGADAILIAIPNLFEAGSATEQARKLNPQLRIIVRAHTEDEEARLRHFGATTVVFGGREIGVGMLGRLSEAGPMPLDRAEQKGQESMKTDAGGPVPPLDAGNPEPEMAETAGAAGGPEPVDRQA